ncbi:dihydrofolate reductase family protein [Jiangella gansuensis]|uniref:dihydrofolate reductase family protein n=1 Tax=Jiangella gansuensis TaxID=281473 RepID=UPI00047E29B3|nr:dihydrofolate reductase family protein [Jiangella gansuensis]
MGKLTYSMATSLDGYAVDADGKFDWAEPDEELHTHFTEVTKSVSTYLYGRRMYETMVYWETAHTIPDQPEFVLEWARVWRAADKVVYSSTLEQVSSERTRLEREFDPDALRDLKAATEGELTIEGPTLAAAALRAGLVDEIGQYLAPVVVGGGTPFFPDGVRLDLRLLEQRRFGNGVVLVRYAVQH